MLYLELNNISLALSIYILGQLSCNTVFLYGYDHPYFIGNASFTFVYYWKNQYK